MRAQAKALASLDLGGVPLYAVLLEDVDNEPQKFAEATGIPNQPLLDVNRAFFPDSMPGINALKVGTMVNTFKLLTSGGELSGNFKGDYSQRAGVVVIGPGEQGILYQHQEDSFGDQADPNLVLAAVARISSGTGSRL